MAKGSKPPPFNPVKAPPVKPPPVSKTKDEYTHHTSPTKGPQAVAPEVVNASRPGAKITKIPEAPQVKYKHGSDS